METENLQFGYNNAEYSKFKKHGWIYLIMFSLLYCSLYCTRNNLASAAPVMMSEMGWSASDIGILTGTLFWTYGIGQLINGRLSEIVGPFKFLIFAIVFSVASNILLGFQSSIWIMAILWGINGYFQSMGWTPGIATLTKWWPGSTRGFATGFAHAFSGFGGAVAQLAVVFAFLVAPKWGWRAAFFVPAAFPTIMLILFLIFAKQSPAKIGLKEYEEEDPEKAAQEAEMQKILETKGKLYPYKYVISNKQFIVWMVVAFATGIARYGLINWVPLYFNQEFNIDVTDGLIQSLVLPVGMGVGTFILPWMTDLFWKGNRLAHVIISSAVGAIAVYIFFLLDPTIPSQFVFIEILLFIAGFCIYAINGVAWAYATDIGGRVFSGTSAGILNFSAYMGSAVQAVVYGFLLNNGGWNIVFISIALFCALITVLGILSVKKKPVTQ